MDVPPSPPPPLSLLLRSRLAEGTGGARPLGGFGMPGTGGAPATGGAADLTPPAIKGADLSFVTVFFSLVPLVISERSALYQEISMGKTRNRSPTDPIFGFALRRPTRETPRRRRGRRRSAHTPWWRRGRRWSSHPSRRRRRWWWRRRHLGVRSSKRKDNNDRVRDEMCKNEMKEQRVQSPVRLKII